MLGDKSHAEERHETGKEFWQCESAEDELEGSGEELEGSGLVVFTASRVRLAKATSRLSDLGFLAPVVPFERVLRFGSCWLVGRRS